MWELAPHPRFFAGRCGLPAQEASSCGSLQQLFRSTSLTEFPHQAFFRFETSFQALQVLFEDLPGICAEQFGQKTAEQTGGRAIEHTHVQAGAGVVVWVKASHTEVTQR